ncbi:MAG TPA: WXG100 family type VII secretion target [Candidatus Dormibacteraeota bacterium]|nr:WXG100 family type VII secretion target [Candidatus Dormibacteraeota bacterium]
MNPALERFFGTPETVLRLATALQQVATTLMELRTAIDSRVSSLVPARWQGAAASAFQKHCEERSDAIHQAAQTADRLSSALQTLGTSLHTAKRLFQLAEQHAMENRLYITPAFVVLPINSADLASDAAVAWVQPEVWSAVTMANTARWQASMELSLVGGATSLGMLRDIGQGAIEWVGEAVHLLQRADNMMTRLSTRRALMDPGGALSDLGAVGVGAWHGAGEIGKKLLGAMEFMGRFSEERQLIDPDGFDRDVKQLVTDMNNTPTSQMVRGGTKLGLDGALVVATGGGGAAAESALFKGAGEVVMKDAAVIGMKDAAEIGMKDAAEIGMKDAAEIGMKDGTEVATTTWPQIELGEIKPIASYEKGLLQLNGREALGNDALVTWTNDGWVQMQVFGTDATGTKVIIQEGSLGQITSLPQLPPGTTEYGLAMEPLVLDRIEQATGWDLMRFGRGYTGPDIVPKP